jgi:hypothetical protein
MEEECKNVGLKLFISDAHHKERCHHGSCCGLPEDKYFSNYAHCQFTEAINIARRNGEVRFSEISEYFHPYLEVLYKNAQGLNTASMKNRADNGYRTLYEFMRTIWNNPKRATSPYVYFDGILYPAGLDENNDVIYKFNKAKYAGSDSK